MDARGRADARRSLALGTHDQAARVLPRIFELGGVHQRSLAGRVSGVVEDHRGAIRCLGSADHFDGVVGTGPSTDVVSSLPSTATITFRPSSRSAVISASEPPACVSVSRPCAVRCGRLVLSQAVRDSR
jgi:hypothetical protein